MAAFATPAALLLRYDYRVIGQMTTVTNIALDEAGVLASPKVEQWLADASGDIVSQCLKGGRYSEADLLALTGNGQAYLERLTCDIAFYHAVKFRGLPVDEYPQFAEAREALAQLGAGTAIFPVQANIDAGVTQSPSISIQTIVDNNFLCNSTSPYFPTPRFTACQVG